MKRGAAVSALFLILVTTGALASRRPTDGASRRPETAVATAVPFDAQASQPKTASQLAPDFTLKNGAGKNVSLSQYRGKKVVLLDFWATWCGPCIMTMPLIEQYRARHPEQVEVLNVNQREDPEKVEAFLKARGIRLNVLFDANGEVSQLYRVYGLPTLLIIDKEGALRFRHVGFRPDLVERLENAVTPLFQ